MRQRRSSPTYSRPFVSSSPARCVSSRGAGAGEPEEPAGVAGDHQLLVGGDHPGGDLALAAGDPRAAGLVRAGVEFDAQPAAGFSDPTADLRGVLADARGEDEAVEPLEDRGEGADLLGCAVDEVVDGEPGGGIGAREQGAHVVARPRETEQARLLVEDLLHLLGGEAELLEEV